MKQKELKKLASKMKDLEQKCQKGENVSKNLNDTINNRRNVSMIPNPIISYLSGLISSSEMLSQMHDDVEVDIDKISLPIKDNPEITDDLNNNFWDILSD